MLARANIYFDIFGGISILGTTFSKVFPFSENSNDEDIADVPEEG